MSKRLKLPLNDPRYRRFQDDMHKWKKAYSTAVELAQELSATKALVLNGESDNWVIQLVEQMTYNGAKAIQHLVKLQFENGRAVIPRHILDVISAIYTPPDVKFTFLLNDTPIGVYTGTLPPPSLESILEESHILPESKDEFYWSQLLHMSKQPVHFVRHTQADKITLNGEDLHRVVPISPMLPLVQSSFSSYSIQLSDGLESATIYLEGYHVESDLRMKIAKTSRLAGWIELDGPDYPLIIFNQGFGTAIYRNFTAPCGDLMTEVQQLKQNLVLPVNNLDNDHQTHLLSLKGKIAL